MTNWAHKTYHREHAISYAQNTINKFTANNNRYFKSTKTTRTKTKL